MEFTFNDEQEILKNSVRKFLEAHCGKSVLRDLEVSGTGFSQTIWKEMSDLGWMGTIIPAEYEGVEITLLELAVILEEIGRAAMPLPILDTTMAALALMQAGTESQKKEFLPQIATGKFIIAVAVEEPEVNYDVEYISSKAEKKDAGYLLNGTKLFVPFATVADYLLVAARTSGSPGDETGLSLFWVETKSPGIGFTEMKTISGRQFRADLSNVSVPASHVIGLPGNALSTLQDIRKKAAALQCIEMVGGAQKELEMTAEYTKMRHQFDRPLGTFQAVQHRLADMYIAVQGARLAGYKAVWRLSEGLPADQEVAIAKYFTNKACQEVAFSAQQLHGGIGFSQEYDLHFYYRRAKSFELRFGPQAHHLKALGAAI